VARLLSPSLKRSAIADVHRDFHAETEISRLWCFPAHSLDPGRGRLGGICRYQRILLL
jgi:hypothetical protein